ncbi:MAG TPA: hypothetical protein VMV26_11595 [Alphaproteobacteria bacterium]|jgi:hypothetical protein|nr:hypothetical protein [Alphaproteobacteria bacterium]
MRDFSEPAPEQRPAVDMADKRGTYRGFTRALRYVATAAAAVGIALALIFFADADIGAALVVGAILLAAGFYALTHRSGARPREVAAPPRRLGSAH